MWKIVIIDDDFQVSRGLRKAIPWEELDAEFAGEAIDGEEGLQLIEAAQPDIVLTDIYMPVMNGIQMIEELKRRGFAGRFVILSGYNDFEYARTAIRLGVDDYLTKPVTVEQIRSVLRATIDKLEETYLSRIEGDIAASRMTLKGHAQEELLLALLNGWGYPQEHAAAAGQLKDRQSMVLVMEVLWNERTLSLSLADWNLFKFAVSNITAEVLGEEWPEAVFAWLFGNHAALLLPARGAETAEAIAADAQRLAGLLVDNMRTYLGLELRIGFGQVKPSWEQIKTSADEAMQMLLEKQHKEQRVKEKDGLAAQETGPADFSPESYFYDITRALQESRDEEALRLFGLYLERKKPEGVGNPQVIRVLAAEIRTLLHNALLMAGFQGLRNTEEGHAQRELAEMKDTESIHRWLEAEIRSLRQTLHPPIQEKHRKAVQFMIEYVHKHYAEDITLERLASQLYISKNYLNQLFKKVTGETFTNYVIRVRIEKAKALLMDGNHLIYEVSEMVGYQNVPYFSTLFKKYCGVSPSEIMKR